jgi:hypothetical protein
MQRRQFSLKLASSTYCFQVLVNSSEFVYTKEPSSKALPGLHRVPLMTAQEAKLTSVLYWPESTSLSSSLVSAVFISESFCCLHRIQVKRLQRHLKTGVSAWPNLLFDRRAVVHCAFSQLAIQKWTFLWQSKHQLWVHMNAAWIQLSCFLLSRHSNLLTVINSLRYSIFVLLFTVLSVSSSLKGNYQGIF